MTFIILKAFYDENTSCDRLEGLPPKFEDWHGKKTLYQVLKLTIKM